MSWPFSPGRLEDMFLILLNNYSLFLIYRRKVDQYEVFFPSHRVAVYVFSQEEVEKVVSLLQEQARTLSRYGMKKHLRILPMYSGLPYADQMKVFERAPSSVRKVSKPQCFHACKEKCMKTFFHE